MSRLFDEAALLQAAAAQVPNADFGPESFKPALHALTRGLTEEARLTMPGAWAAVGRLVQSLKRRRLLAQMMAVDPGLSETPIEAPIVIVGFPRTGTTLLHNLLGANPAHRAIRLWEMREPFAPSGAAASWAEDTQKMTAQLVEAGYQLAPRLVDIHPLRAQWPDECSWLFRNSFATLVNAFSHYMPTYADWVMSRARTPDYAYFRLQLQAILSQRPGQPLVLKDPCHVWHLDALLAVFPDARVVHLHRDVEDVVGSFASLCHALQEGTSAGRSNEELGAYAVHMLEVGMERMLSAREALPSSAFTDLGYEELVADPLAAIARLHDRWGLPLGSDAIGAMEAWLGESRSLTGRHSYDLDRFGLSPEAIRERFSPYTARFAPFLTVTSR